MPKQQDCFEQFAFPDERNTSGFCIDGKMFHLLRAHNYLREMGFTCDEATEYLDLLYREARNRIFVR